MFETLTEKLGSVFSKITSRGVLNEKDISVKRKLKEAIRAYKIEKQYSKDEILTMYLNIVPLSNNCIGVAAASQLYFGRTRLPYLFHGSVLFY